jgi:hypothetical protein
MTLITDEPVDHYHSLQDVW